MEELARALARNRPRDVRNTIKGGADPNYIGQAGLTPLLFAMCHKRNIAAVGALVEGGADPNFGPPGGPTPMGLASRATDGALLKLFLALGASPNPITREEEPYTVAAIYADCFGNFWHLINAGADLNAIAAPNITLVGFLCESEHWSLAAQILKRGADPELAPTPALSRAIITQSAPSPRHPDHAAYLEVLTLLGLDQPPHGGPGPIGPEGLTP